MGGDTVAVRDGVVHRNGRAVPRTRLPGPCRYIDTELGSERQQTIDCIAYRETLGQHSYRVFHHAHGPGSDFPATRVPAGHVFVMGDNRDNSADSRCWGFVPRSHVKGQAMFLWWSSASHDGVRWHRLFDAVD